MRYIIEVRDAALCDWKRFGNGDYRDYEKAEDAWSNEKKSYLSIFPHTEARFVWPELCAFLAETLVQPHTLERITEKVTDWYEVAYPLDYDGLGTPQPSDIDYALAILNVDNNEDTCVISMPVSPGPAPVLARWAKIVWADPSAHERDMLAHGHVMSSAHVHALLSPRMTEETVMTMTAIFLTVGNRVIGLSEIARGGKAQMAVSVADVFRTAVATGAGKLIVAINHPGMDNTLSKDEIAIAKSLHAAGQILKIELVDFIVIAGRGDHAYSSMCDLGLIDRPVAAVC